ncbi:MAG: hypothetical protein K9N23_13640 [Akkermansiaceae bacterium]|nr:hypothetical protein [Akkermansiaceae bacterium]MCF7732726.1 hypothetical protein [Akkermansiaceae bacterium]
MKRTFTKAWPLASVLLVAQASAFTLDFSSLSLGTPVPNAPGGVTLNVAGYGDVKFQSAPGGILELAADGGLNAVNSETGEPLVVTFLADPLVTEPIFDDETLPSGEGFIPADIGSKIYEVTFSGTDAAVSAVHFIPEPSTLLFGAFGSLALLIRRR